jgi:ribosomal protein L37AE/L43A
MDNSYGTLKLGIDAVRAGNRVEGARLLRVALRGEELTAQLRAIAYLWLAETHDSPEHKLAAYNDAISADPNNTDAQQRLAALLAAQLPPMPPMPQNLPETRQLPPAPPYTSPLPPAQSTSYAATPQPGYIPYSSDVNAHVVGIVGGPNGAGSGFYIAPEGIIATTRYIVGGLERVLIEIQQGQQITAEVLRSYPELDLCFLRAEYAPRTTLPITPLARVPDESALVMVSYGRQPAGGAQRITKRALAAHWLPTTFGRLEDAGGAPLFDQQSYLVGMMTRNTARNSGHYFALHIHVIRARLEAFMSEARSEARTYCPSCGTGSRAGGAGFFFCETCGSTLPRAQHVPRYPLPQAEYYYGVSGIRCTRCGAQAGFYAGSCLRCGQAPETKAR